MLRIRVQVPFLCGVLGLASACALGFYYPSLWEGSSVFALLSWAERSLFSASQNCNEVEAGESGKKLRTGSPKQ